MRAILDPNVIISAVLSPMGSPARVLRFWIDGAFEVFVSVELLTELERALAYPKLRKRIEPDQAVQLVELVRREAFMIDDPKVSPRVRSIDANDDYLIDLGEATHAVIVSGDRHLLDLADQIPVYAPSAFLELLA
ncbi:MAG: putative toxin-antitoxin system toxin component, PIN family [Actinobacteria bacterium]|nr:putative toxin-antitoxin system toxin component, PIN family [Actinomycetota bacterium]